MAIQSRETDPGPDDSVSEPNGPGKGPMGPGWIIAVALYLVIASVFVLYGLIKLWPYPTPSGELKVEASATPSPSPAGSTASSTPAETTSPAVRAAPPAGGPGPAIVRTPTATPTPTPAPSQTPTPTPSPTVAKRVLPDPEPMSFFGGRLTADIYLETRLLLLVMLAGALGSLMHSLRSLYWYTGNRMMVWSWVGYYLLLPFTGAMLSVIFYFVVRGGFFSPQASFENTSPFGFAALSALVGLFSPQATLKLKEIAETIFTKPGAGTDAKAQPSSAQTPPEDVAPAAPSGDAVVDSLDGHDADMTADTLDEHLPITEGGVG